MDLIRLKSIFPEMILNVVVFRDDQALSEDNSGEVTVIGSSNRIMKIQSKVRRTKIPFSKKFQNIERVSSRSYRHLEAINLNLTWTLAAYGLNVCNCN